MRHTPGSRARERVTRRTFVPAVALSAVAFLVAPASAEVVAIDDQVPISSELPGTRRHPAVAGNDRYYDSFLVVWD
jgi:hypothetical protein